MLVKTSVGQLHARTLAVRACSRSTLNLVAQTFATSFLITAVSFLSGCRPLLDLASASGYSRLQRSIEMRGSRRDSLAMSRSRKASTARVVSEFATMLTRMSLRLGGWTFLSILKMPKLSTNPAKNSMESGYIKLSVFPL